MMNVRDKLMQLFRDTGIDPKLETFENRMQLQKLTYLLEIFGMEKLDFSFSWYIHGPYNRILTQVLYDDDKSLSQRKVDDEFKDEKKNIVKLKEFLGSDIHSSRSLELIGSLHYLLVIGKRAGVEDTKMIEKLQELKPYFSKEEIMHYYRRIIEFNLI